MIFSCEDGCRPRKRKSVEEFQFFIEDPSKKCEHVASAMVTFLPPPTSFGNLFGSVPDPVRIAVRPRKNGDCLGSDGAFGDARHRKTNSPPSLFSVDVFPTLPLPINDRIARAAGTGCITRTGRRNPSSWRRRGRTGRRSDGRLGRSEISSR